MAQIKNAIPAVGTTNALTVNRCRILWTGNQIAGSEQSQKMKKETKSLVFVPELGMPLWRLVNDGQIASIMSLTHSPPIQAWTPYQIQAMAALLKTGQRAPQIPKLERDTTGNEMWYVAPIRPVMHTKQAAIAYPSQTQIHDCHHDSPWETIAVEEIIQVLILKLSDTLQRVSVAEVSLKVRARSHPSFSLNVRSEVENHTYQNPTKFHGPH
jgi:hypothetical protein